MSDHIAPDDPQLLASVREGEGLRRAAYPDPLSPLAKELAKPLNDRCVGYLKLSGAPWTIGYGHTSADVVQGDTCTYAQAERWLEADLADACATLDHKEPWWRTMSAARQRVLAEMTFNLGYGHLIGFHRFLVDLQAQRWSDAADEMLNSLWATETGNRARRLANIMRTA